MESQGSLLNCLACEADRLSEELAKQEKARYTMGTMIGFLYVYYNRVPLGGFVG